MVRHKRIDKVSFFLEVTGKVPREQKHLETPLMKSTSDQHKKWGSCPVKKRNKPLHELKIPMEPHVLCHKSLDSITADAKLQAASLATCNRTCRMVVETKLNFVVMVQSHSRNLKAGIPRKTKVV